MKEISQLEPCIIGITFKTESIFVSAIDKMPFFFIKLFGLLCTSYRMVKSQFLITNTFLSFHNIHNTKH